MERWNQDSRREPVIVDLDALVPQDHLLRKIERVMDYDWLYARLEPYYCHHNGRPGTDPVVLIKMVLIQHLFGIPSLRQTYQRIQDTLSYRWFLGYSLLDEIPHFATVSYAFCKRFPVELAEEIFAHILNKALNHRMVDPKLVFIDGTHIKASANKNKSRKQQVIKAAKVYAFTCPHGGVLRHTTTSKDGKRTYRSTPSHCRNCPYRSKCGADEKGQKVLTTHIWQEYLDLVEEIRKTKLGKALYAQRKETVERVFADAKEKHAMRYTHHRGLAAVTRWVRLKYAAMNLKKLALWSWGTAPSPRFFAFFFPFYARTLAFSC